MRPAVCLVACVFSLSACDKGPKVTLNNASANTVASAVNQSGVMNSDMMIEPGLWESKVTVTEMNIPGIPPQYAEKMKKSIAESRNHTSRHCITAADVKKPKEDFFGADKSCKYQHFAMGGGKIDIQMVCARDSSRQTTTMSGTYAPSRYSMDMATAGVGGDHSSMSMKMHVESNRISTCKGNGG